MMLSAGFAIITTMILITMLMNGSSEKQTIEGLRRSAELIASGVEKCGGRYLDETEFDKGVRVKVTDINSIIITVIPDENK